MNPLLIFDVDGTLCDTVSVDDECYGATASAMLGLPVDSSSWVDSPHITDLGIVEWLWTCHAGRLPSAQEVEEFVARFELDLGLELRRAPERFRAIAGAPRLLGHLEEKGWRFAFATGGWGRTARLKLKAAGLPVASLLASSDDSHDRFEIFKLAETRALASFGGPLARTILVGDGIWDVQVAARLGWSMVGVGSGQRATRLHSEGASVVLPDFSDLDRVATALSGCVIPGTAPVDPGASQTHQSLN